MQRSVPYSASVAPAQADLPQGGARLGDGAAGGGHEGAGCCAEVVAAWHPPLPDPDSAGQCIGWRVRSTDCVNGQRSEPSHQQSRSARSLQRPLHGTGQGSAIKLSSRSFLFFVCFFYKFASMFRSL